MLGIQCANTFLYNQQKTKGQRAKAKFDDCWDILTLTLNNKKKKWKKKGFEKTRKWDFQTAFFYVWRCYFVPPLWSIDSLSFENAWNACYFCDRLLILRLLLLFWFLLRWLKYAGNKKRAVGWLGRELLVSCVCLR